MPKEFSLSKVARVNQNVLFAFSILHRPTDLLQRFRSAGNLVMIGWPVLSKGQTLDDLFRIVDGFLCQRALAAKGETPK